MESLDKSDHFITSRVRQRTQILRLLRHHVRKRRVAVAILMIAVYLLVLHLEYREALRTKYEPTYLSTLSIDVDELALAQWQPTRKEAIDDRLRLWEERGRWKPLGAGYEGTTSVRSASVIKAFTANSPLRNCVPSVVPEIRWPTEIPVSLLLGGRHSRGGDPVPDDADFVPVEDFFLAPEADFSKPHWHLVTPFLESGNLEKLASGLHGQQLTYRDLDERFRPSLERLLAALDSMHNEHNLCHDDMKPDNIFVTTFSNASTEDTHWLLADLGNARHPAHGYHSSRLWGPDNGQHTDCRVNDVLRLVKSYVKFLRQGSAADTSSGLASFEEAIFAGREPWSQLYWSVVDNQESLSMSTAAAATVLKESLRSLPISPEDSVAERNEVAIRRPAGFALGRSALLARAVDKELSNGMSASEKWARIFGVIGVPASPC